MNAPVFISARNADYAAAREVYQFLTDRGIGCFFSDESLLRVGESRYQAKVKRALTVATRLLLVTSSRGNAESQWVRYQWDSFDKDLVSGHKPGCIVTVLCDGLCAADLPAELRGYQTIDFPGQLESLYRYLVTPGAKLESERNAAGSDIPRIEQETGADRRPGPRAFRLLTLVTVGNALALGVIVWLICRHGIAGFSEEPAGSPRSRASRAKGGPGAGGVFRERSLTEGGKYATPRAGTAAADPSFVSDAPAGGMALSAKPGADNLRDTIRNGTPINLWDTPLAGTPYNISLSNGDSLTFSFIPRGAFMMGSPADESGRDTDEALHAVTITKDFWLARTECTQTLWQSVMGGNPAAFTGHPELPVESVSWTEVTGGSDSFIATLNAMHILPEGWRFALPTEAQWEYACRAGTATPFSFGPVLDSTMANFDGNLPYGTRVTGTYLARTARAGSYPANPWGLYDMHGNVWEWCEDAYQRDLADGIDPFFKTGESRVQRGGSWHFNARLCRSASRDSAHQDAGDYSLGFRPAIVAVE